MGQGRRGSGEGDAKDSRPMFRMPTGMGSRKDMEAQAYEAMGMADVVRKNYDGAAADYKQSLTTGSHAESGHHGPPGAGLHGHRQVGQRELHSGQSHQHARTLRRR